MNQANSDQELPKLYGELASWWHLLSAPAEYEDEAAFFHKVLSEACEIPPQTMLELGSGGGNNASHLKAHYRMTLNELHQDLSEMLAILILNSLFLALITLLFWPLSKVTLAFSLVKGYALLWLVTIASVVLLTFIEWLFGLNSETHYNTYVGLNLAASILLVAGWSAFVALTIRNFAFNTPIWLVIILYFIGIPSSYITFAVVTSFYKGSIYKVANLPLALVTYLVFALWPAAGWLIYGWFFALFGMGR